MNDYYNPTGLPSDFTKAKALTVNAQFNAIKVAFEKLPPLAELLPGGIGAFQSAQSGGFTGSASQLNAALASMAQAATFPGTAFTLQGGFSSNGLISSQMVIARGAPAGGGAEGGQIVLGFPGNDDITAQEASTWNLDVDSTAHLRLFVVTSLGVTVGVFDVDPAGGAMLFLSELKMAARDASNGGIFRLAGSAGFSDSVLDNFQGSTRILSNAAGSTTLVVGNTGAGVMNVEIDGTVRTPGYPTYASEADASAAGLAPDTHYKTPTGEMRIKL